MLVRTLHKLLLLPCLFGFYFQFASVHADPGGKCPERVFVHTDRDIYVAGETLFFSLSLIRENQAVSASGIAYLMIRGEGGTRVEQLCIKTKDGKANGSIQLPDTLGTGFYQLLAFTNVMRNFGEAGYFSKELIIANLFDKELKSLKTRVPVHVDSSILLSDIDRVADSLVDVHLQDHYPGNSKIGIRLKLNGSLPGRLSCSVHEETLFDILRQHGGKKGLVEEDLLIPAPAASEQLFLSESEGQIIQGRVVDIITREGIPGCYIYLSAEDTVVNLQYDVTGTNGLFRFRLNDYYQGKKLVLSIQGNKGLTSGRIDLDDKFETGQGFKPISRELPPATIQFIHECQDMFMVQRVYQQLPLVRIQNAIATDTWEQKIYDQPDQLVYPSDYERLNDFTEISRELLPTVRVRKGNEKNRIELTDEVNRGFFKEEPALFVNGVLTHDNSGIFSYGSQKIRRIEVVNAPRVFGDLYFPGILALFTSDSTNLSVPLNGLTFKADPYYPSSFLQAPEPSNPHSTIPDFRTLLYWNPMLELKPGSAVDIEFSSSLHTGNYILEIEGFDNAGDRMHKISRFRVD